MEMPPTNIKEFLTRNDSVIERLREVALREFEKGSEGLALIISELSRVQAITSEGQLRILADCLSEITSVLQSWIADPVFLNHLADLFNPWSDVIYELSNYFVFMGEEDETDLRNRVNYRLVQLAKASAALVTIQPAAENPKTDGSWGLFDETAAAPEPQAAAPTLARPSVEASPKVEIPVKAAPPEAPAENILASHYLICLLGSQQYALPIHQVREILEQRHEKPLPAQRPGIVGLVTVRGLVCPVVDVSHILYTKDEPEGSREGRKRCTVVCEVDRRTFCFNVDDVKQVASINEFQDQITPLNPEHSIQKAISHVAHFQDKSVLFVKMREVIPA